jgi:hypothetical protein
MNERKVLELSYTSFDSQYTNGSLRYIRGFQDANSSANPVTVGTLDDPRSAGFPMRPEVADTKIFSFAYRGEVRFLVCKVGSGSQAGKWSLLMAPTPPLGAWAILARDIQLKDKSGNFVLANPYGAAQAGRTLYIPEYDSKKVWSIGVNELNGLEDNADYTLSADPLDLGIPAPGAALPANAQGQAIIALSPATGSPSVFVLFTVSTVTSNPPPQLTQDPGILARLTVGSNGVLSYDTKVTVGRNPQELVPVTDNSGVTRILIPAIGGMQKAGSSNGGDSNITSVPAFGSWSSYAQIGAPVLLKGDGGSTGGATYDIHDLGASYRANNGDGFVYILTLIYAAGYAGTNWRLYRITVADLLSLSNTTISDALDAGLESKDSGMGTSGYFWQLLYETGSDDTKDRLYFFRGAALLVCPAKAYPATVATVPPNASYRYFNVGEKDGDIGGDVVDWADLSIETVNQIAAGHSLKRSVQASVPKGAEEENK